MTRSSFSDCRFFGSVGIQSLLEGDEGLCQRGGLHESRIAQLGKAGAQQALIDSSQTKESGLVVCSCGEEAVGRCLQGGPSGVEAPANAQGGDLEGGDRRRAFECDHQRDQSLDRTAPAHGGSRCAQPLPLGVSVRPVPGGARASEPIIRQQGLTPFRGPSVFSPPPAALFTSEQKLSEIQIRQRAFRVGTLAAFAIERRRVAILRVA